MIEQTINEWLSEFSGIDEGDNHSSAINIIQNSDLISSLYSYLDDVNKFQKVICIVKVCDVLFRCYRSSEPELRQFTLQFLPQILYTYLNAVAHSDKKTSHVTETLIIGIYNLEVVSENGQPEVLSFRLPSLAQSSIYHEPVSLAPASLTESALKRLEQRDSQLVRWGPLQPVEKLIAQNRLSILSELLFCYNRQIGTLARYSIEKLCKITMKIVTQGFSKSLNSLENYRRSSINVGGDGNIPIITPRITISSKFLSQLVYSLYFALFNGFKLEATQAIDAIAVRASYHGLNEVILLTNAVKNCSYLLSTDQSENTPGIRVSVANTSISTTTTLSKSMITNASFRTKKLPEDIPIQDPQQESVDSLGAISEEKDENNSTTPEIHPRRSLPRMAANFGKKTKEKIATAVKSGSVASIKSITKSNSILTNGGDVPETDESGIELSSSDMSNLAIVDAENTSTPYSSRKSFQISNTIDIDVTRSMQLNVTSSSMLNELLKNQTRLENQKLYATGT